MWLVFSLIAPLFFAVVHVLDSYSVKDIFEKPWMGMVTSAAASIIVLAPLPFLIPLLGWSMPSLSIIILALLSGALIQLSQAFYFQALSYSEAGIVAAYWNMVPALVPIFSIFIFKERLNTIEYVAIYILLTSSILFCLVDTNLHTRWKSFRLMSISALMQAVMFLLQEILFNNVSYYLGFILITIGLIITGLTPLLLKSVRKTFYTNKNIIRKTAKFFVLIEVINLFALASSQKAVDLGIPSFVAAVESTIPVYTFLLLLFLTQYKHKFGDVRAKTNIGKKITLITIMSIAISILV